MNAAAKPVRALVAMLVLAAGSASTSPGVPPAAALAVPLAPAELAATQGGLEARLSNVGATQLLPDLSGPRTVHVEVTSPLFLDDPNASFQVTAQAGGQPLPLTATRIMRTAPAEAGSVATAVFDLTPACGGSGVKSLTVDASVANGTWKATTSRLIVCR
jgi:hypothetical protein